MINYNVPPASPVASVVVFFEIWVITIGGGLPREVSLRSELLQSLSAI